MKSFIFALLMLFSVTVFITFNAHQNISYIDEMLALTEILPKDKFDFENQSEQTLLAVNELTALWKKWFPLISFATGYENTNRCDEAIGALAIHFKNGNGEDFFAVPVLFSTVQTIFFFLMFYQTSYFFNERY